MEVLGDFTPARPLWENHSHAQWYVRYLHPRAGVVRETLHYGAFTPWIRVFLIFTKFSCTGAYVRQSDAVSFWCVIKKYDYWMHVLTAEISVRNHPAYSVPGTDLVPEMPTEKSLILTLLSCFFCLSSLHPFCFGTQWNSLIELYRSFSTMSFFLERAK